MVGVCLVSGWIGGGGACVWVCGGVGGRNQGGQEVFPDGMFVVKEAGV